MKKNLNENVESIFSFFESLSVGGKTKVQMKRSK